MPLCGLILSKLLGYMTLPIEVLDYLALQDTEFDGTGLEYLEVKMKFWVSMMTIIAVANGIFSYTQTTSFGYLGENVTYEIRKLVYNNILQKNIGWFDLKENSASVLTAAMATDTSVINGVSTESIGPQVEGLMALCVGLGLGFWACWQEALVCLIVSPVMVIGNVLGMKFHKGMEDSQTEALKDANLLCGDSIGNYKTVLSFGNNEMFVEKYRELLHTAHKQTTAAYLKIGFAFGMAQFAMYCVFAVMFYAGGEIISSSYDEVTKTYSINVDDVFIALFAIMFGASHMGTAQGFGPDMAKSSAAAERIFKIINHPSPINAIEMDKDTTKQRLNLNKVEGKIEFKDVWFRYPTRKEDFVHRGLNITINPSERVALVGESGCGKSTFVNLMMRFYDIDHGEILLDGVNIKDINLYDLRKAISLVMQEPIIFNYCILENILYGKTDATNTEVLDACKVANALEFIQRNEITMDDSAQNLIKEMEKHKEKIVATIGQEKYDEEMEILKKMDTAEQQKGDFQAISGNIDDRPESLKDVKLSQGFENSCGIKGGKLSGGQKQRVAIARTVIRSPKVLLLDEATSALDEDSQKKVQEALDQAMEGRTTIIIAHRLSTIEKCDKIFVLEHGKLMEEGNFEELKGKGGAFTKLTEGKKN